MMEMTSDLIAIQGLLSSVVKTTGDFSKVMYKGGNEMKINQVIKELDDYLTSKLYLSKRVSNKTYYKELQDITLFLVINLDFKSNIIEEIKEFSHLINIIPTLSKCLLANIVIELDLSEYYCNAIHNLPAQLSEELLSEIIPCIKKCTAATSLELTYLYMKNIIKKISLIDVTNYKMTECIEKLEDISAEMLLHCSGINIEQMQGLNKVHIYKHMGQTLFCLLKLLLHCQIENEVLFKIIDDLISSVCMVMSAVTVHVFCAWTEVEHKGEPLQSVIGEEAYHVIEKYQKYEPAKPLMQMITSIAKKPKSLNEIIHEANSTTMILKIEQNPVDRTKWFTALLNTQVFQSKETKECVNRWANLCSSDDLERLLNLSVNHKNEEDVINIIIKCASFFSEDELIIIITRFFRQYGLKSCLRSKNTAQQLTIILNKLEKDAVKEPNKDVLLLILQDPETVLSTLCRESVKNSILLQSLSQTFLSIGEILAVEKLFVNILKKILEENKIESHNLENYKKLFGIIANTNYKTLMQYFLIPCLNQNLTNGEYDVLNHMFYIYSEILDKKSYEEIDKLIGISINILEKCRWKIFDFSNIKAALCQQIIQILLGYKNLHFNPILDEDVTALNHVINKYYLIQLKTRTELNFLEFVCPHLQIDKHAEAVGYLIKLLPLCVPTEWITIANTIIKKYENEKCLEIITDSLVIVSQVAKTQAENDNGCILNGLRFCIQNYGLILKDIILPLENEEINVVLVRNICRLLRDIPSDVIDIEGMSLISLIPDKTLKSLTKDEKLISILLSMNGSQISRIIAKRMIE